MVPNGMKIGKEQLNVLTYAYDIVLTGKNETEIRQLFVETENIARKLGLQINQRKTKYTIVEWKNSSKQNKTGELTIRNYMFERVENNHQIHLQERIKNANTTYFMTQKFLEIKIYLKN
jgi:hypothetical protein